MTIQNDPVQVLEIIGSPPELWANLGRNPGLVSLVSLSSGPLFHPELYAMDLSLVASLIGCLL